MMTMRSPVAPGSARLIARIVTPLRPHRPAAMAWCRSMPNGKAQANVTAASQAIARPGSVSVCVARATLNRIYQHQTDGDCAGHSRREYRLAARRLPRRPPTTRGRAPGEEMQQIHNANSFGHRIWALGGHHDIAI